MSLATEQAQDTEAATANKVTAIDGYLVDAALEQEETYDTEVSMDPVERGSPITDHVTNMPVTWRVTGVISDTPIGQLATTRANQALSSTAQNFTPSSDARARFLKIRADREPITVLTSNGEMTNMVMTSLSLPRDSKTGRALRFSATFVQIAIVEVERLLVTIPTAAKKRNLGFNPFSAAKAGAAAVNDGVKTGVDYLVTGGPSSIRDADGRLIAVYDQRQSKWIDSKGREVVPFQPDGSGGVRFDQGQQQWVAASTGVPITRSPVANVPAPSGVVAPGAGDPRGWWR